MARKFIFILFITFSSLFTTKTEAQTTAERSDSLVASHLHATGVKLTDNNKVVLLMNGHDKFEDLFKEVRKAKKFILHKEAASKIEMKNKILDFLKDNSAFIKLMNEDSFDEALKELLLEKLAVDYVRSVASKINEVENFK